VLSDKASDKGGTDTFEIDSMFTHSQIAVQVFFVDTAKRAQKIACGRPQPFDGVGMHFPDAIPILIAGPFLLAVPHRVMSPFDAVVALPLIRITGGACLSVAVDVFLQRLAIGMLAHAQSTLPTLPADGADDGRTIVLIGPVPTAFVGAAARRIARVAVFVAFFPPRSETSPRFPSRCPVTLSRLTSYIRWLGAVGATDARTDGRA